MVQCLSPWVNAGIILISCVIHSPLLIVAVLNHPNERLILAAAKGTNAHKKNNKKKRRAVIFLFLQGFHSPVCVTHHRSAHTQPLPAKRKSRATTIAARKLYAAPVVALPGCNEL